MRALAIIAVLALGACRDAAPAAGAASRVVSLHDVTTEIVVALGAVDRLAGISDPVDAAPTLVAAVAAVPRVAGLESIVVAEADLVLGLGVVAEQDPELVRALEDRGVAVLLADPARLADLEALVTAIAARLDREDAGAAVIAQLRARVDEATVTTPAPRRVFVFDCCDPPFTAGGATIETELLARAGAVNVFADVDADWTHVSWEEVVARRPELIVVHDYRWDGQGDVAAKRAALRAIPMLGDLPVEVLPLGCALGGLRSVEGLERLRAAIASGG